ncbi:sedoheptulokinase [Paenibacillus monticola]|uniref:Carbohydrate kinase n=1 Tax=Paenibacillus monticola TaxID=2666075 RepID=A0A7X2H7E7_9BACL|nr:FGGY family carbohydrate kinase [Paenibacillus monticola]MRN54902.1 hypothetical protein [Paenibacillus monticola]
MKFIGIDIGTTTITGLVYDLERKTILHSNTADNLVSSHLSSEEWERQQDPDEIFLQVEDILNNLIAWEPEVLGIGLTGQMHGIVYVDLKGKHVSPLYTWQDGRGSLAMEDSHSYADYLSEHSGYTVAPGYGLVTHFYNLRNGLVPASAVSFCTIADYVALRLTGTVVPLIDPTQAAGMGCYNFELNDFDKVAIAAAGLDPAMLPKVVPSGAVIGLTNQGIPVHASLGDNQASFLGSVPHPEETVLMNIGTGSQLSVLLPEYSGTVRGMEVRPYPGGGVLMVGAALSGGKSYALLESFFRQLIRSYTGEEPTDVYSLMDQLLRIEPNEARGLRVSPRFLGTRTDPDVRGTVKGITLDNFTPGSLTHAFLQGMIDELYAFFRVLEEKMVKPFKLLIGSGNALRANPELCTKAQITFGLPLKLSDAPEEAAVGAALCAAVGSGQIASFREAGQFISSYRTVENNDDEEEELQLPPSAEKINELMRKYSLSYPQKATLEQIIVQPGQAIGPFRLGMTEAEIGISARNYPMHYNVEYDEAGLASFIEIAEPGEEWSCRYRDMDLFRTTAKKLIADLDQESPYDRKYAETGCTYLFSSLGLTLWRSSELTEEEMCSEEFKALPADIQEDELRHLYFEAVAVMRIKENIKP